MSKSKNNTDSGSWEVAAEMCRPLLPFPALFANTVRFLNGTLPWDGEFRHLSSLVHLYSSKKVQCIVYHAAKHLHPEKFTEGIDLSEGKLLELLSPKELSAVFAITYLYRRLRRGCDEKVWLILSKETRGQIQTAICIGRLTPALGIAVPTCASAFRNFGLILMARDGPKHFREYRHSLHKSNRLFDPELETRLWGCSHLQVASLLLQSFGFGRYAAEGVGVGLDPTASGELTEEARTWRNGALWVESVLSSSAPDQRLIAAEPQAAGEIFHRTQKQVEAFGADIMTVPWLADDATELAPEIEQELFGSTSNEAIPPTDDDAVVEQFLAE